MPAGDVERPSEEDDSEEQKKQKKEEEEEEKRNPTNPNSVEAQAAQATPRDQLKCAAKRVKERHVALRVKNLVFLSTLNEEALRLQGRLWSMLERSSGALLPEISVSQKSTIFELVTQLLDFSLAECSRLVAIPSWSLAPGRILEKAFAFALALEHSKAIAMPADSRTQALKLAALIDKDLLCQMIDGPFRRRLHSTGAAAATGSALGAAGAGGLRRGSYGGGYGRCRLPRNSQAASNYTGPATWEEAVQAFCDRFLEALRSSLQRAEPGSAD